MNAPSPTPERLWLVYLFAVVGVSVLAPDGARGAGMFWSHLAVHALMASITCAVARLARRDHDAARWWRAGMAVLGLPIVFWSMSWLLPHVHPEPFEYRWLALDRAAFGDDAGRAVDALLTPWFAEVLQLVYALFYFVPVVAALMALRRSGRQAFDRAVAILVGAFLASYLGYVLVPTLAPKVALAFDRELQGLWLFPQLRASIDDSEGNPWNCFPSGHTMLTVVSLIVAWRWHRRVFWLLLMPALLLIASTVLLRYHWTIDVVVGAAAAWPAVRVVDWLLDRDGWPPAERSAQTQRVTV